jgi:hypothetical protein
MNSVWLRSVLAIFLLSTVTWAVAFVAVFTYWNGGQLLNLLEVNGYALSHLLARGEIGIAIPRPAVKRDSLEVLHEKLEHELSGLESKINSAQSAADSMDFEILLRQVKLNSLDSTQAQSDNRLVEQAQLRVKQMAKIMASSPAETINKMSIGMDDSLLAKFVGASSNREAARILGALTPDRVAQVTRQLSTAQASK